MDYPTFLLEVRSVAKRFGPTNVLKDANLSIAPGEIHALPGGNGAGKSTFIKIISGQLESDAGTLRFGAAADDATGRARARFLKRAVDIGASSFGPELRTRGGRRDI
jgi:ABC-type sugar transport system ATPase subunit